MINKFKRVMAVSLVVSAAAYSGSAFAAFAGADASFTGVVEIRTTGDATATFTETDVFEASGSVSDGMDDPANNGTSFDSQFNLAGDEGTAINAGPGESIASQSLVFVGADVPDISEGTAFTFIDSEIEFAGVGSIEIDLGYELFVDVADNGGPDGFAAASISASLGSAFEEIALLVDGVADGGDFAEGIITLIIDVDDFGFGPYTDFLIVSTEAAALASPVPVPAAVWLLGSAIVGLFRVRRRVA